MRYLGGKSRIAKYIAPIVNVARNDERPYFWDPFCGGLSMSVKLAAYGPGIVSDKNPALIALYQAVRDGWDPPETLGREEWEAARELSDSDPLKAFAGFGCSFSGIWFQGYAGAEQTRIAKVRTGDQKLTERPVFAAANGLRRDTKKLSECFITTCDFLSVTPAPIPIVIYADPPYAGVTGYAATGPFDHDLFWRRCQEWERFGVPVFVSEYACPVPHEMLWERTYGLSMSAGKRTHTDRLFRVIV